MQICAYPYGTVDRTSRQDVFRLHAQFCKAFADPTRLLLLVELRRGARTVGELAQAIGASQPATSRHLGLLRQRGIVEAERDGSFVRYSLADRRILTAIDILLEALAAQLSRQGARGGAARRLRPTGRLTA
jgi:DNA-binding transcriptional ArsR family regulator